MLLATLCACAPQPQKPEPDENTRAMPGALSRIHPTNIDTLAELLPPATADMHWGLAKVDNQVTALRAIAWTADDRHVEIRAQTTNEGLAVQVTVGRFGHPADEAQFHRVLARRLESVQ